MSQQKVDQYKKEKANRQQIMKREKFRTRLGVVLAAVVLIGLIGWFGVSVYQNAKASENTNNAAVSTTLDTSDVDAYLNDVRTSVEAE